MSWFEERTGARALALRAAERLSRPVPRSALGVELGTVAVLLLLIQLATGALLLIYYVPSWVGAHASVTRLVTEVHFGWLVRSVHVWGAHLFVLTTLLHLIHTFARGACARPREVTWWAGVLLLMGVLGAALTGQSLPMNEESVAGMSVAGAFADELGLGGLVRGGADVGPATLSRMFAAHVTVIPWLLVLMVAAHLALAARHGLRGLEPAATTGRPFLARVTLAALAAAALLAILAFAFPPGVEPTADPLSSRPGVKPMWVFLPVYEAVKHVPVWAGVAIPAIPVAFLFLVPFLPRRASIAIGAILLAAAVALGILGARAA